MASQAPPPRSTPVGSESADSQAPVAGAAAAPPNGAQPGASPHAAAAPAAAGAAQPSSRKGLWGNPDFLKLWGGQSLSLIGTQVTVLALPLVAVQLLNANSSQMGILGALARAPFVLYLFAGVWADHFRRRPTMIVTDLGRAVLLGLIPVLYFADMLRMEWLYVLVLAVGVLGVFFEVSNQAFLPSLVGPEHVAEGNAKMQVSQSVAQVAGPSVAGALIAVVSAASVIIIDAVSYVVGAVASALIRKPEPPPTDKTTRPKVFAAIGVGLRWIWTQPIFRPMVLATAFYMTFLTGIQALYVLYARRTLGLSGELIGVTLAFLGVGAIVGSLISLKVLRKIGPGPAALWSTVVGNSAVILVPLAAGPKWLVVALLCIAQALVGLTTPIAQVGMGSLRMVMTPNEMQGRVVATFRGLSLGLAPVGALVAGFVGSAAGLRPTMWIFAVGVLVPIFVILFSPIPGIKQFPRPSGAAA